MSYELFYTRQARKDAKKLKGSPLAAKAKELLALISEDPFADPPPFEALVGDLNGAYSRRKYLITRPSESGLDLGAGGSWITP